MLHFFLFLFLFAVRIIQVCALFFSPFVNFVTCLAIGNEWDFDPQTKMCINFVQATAILRMKLLDPLPSSRTILRIDVGEKALAPPGLYLVLCDTWIPESLHCQVYILSEQLNICMLLCGPVCVCVSVCLFAVKHALFLDISIKLNLTCVVDWCYFLLLLVVCACVRDYVRACVRAWLCVHACRKSSPLVDRVAQVHLVVAMMKGLRLQLEAVVLARAVASQVLRKPAMTLCRSMQHYEAPLCRLCAAHFYAFVRWCGYLFQCMLCYVMSSLRTSLKNTGPFLLLLNRVQGANGYCV